DLTPALQGRMQSVFLRRADGAVDGHSGVDLGMDVVATLAAPFPDPPIGLVPAGLDFLHQPTLVVPAALVQTHAAAPGDMQQIHQLAIDIQLVLTAGGIAGAYRT